MPTWHVRVSFTSREAFDEDAPFDVSDRLHDYAAVMSVSRAFDGGSIAMTIDAADVIEAGRLCELAAMSALGGSGIVATITGLQVQSRDDFEDELSRPVYPRVVGYAEVADMASVSRQRARQFADKDSFPKPVIVTAQGPLFDFHAIEQWLANRSSKPQPAHA